MTSPRTSEHAVHFHARGRGRLELRLGVPPAVAAEPVRPVPRLARLMALALRWALIRCGQVKAHAELARLAHLTRARISQIVNLVHRAPDIQEQLLFLENRPRGCGAIVLADLQPLAALADWRQQRRHWLALRGGRKLVSARARRRSG